MDGKESSATASIDGNGEIPQLLKVNSIQDSLSSISSNDIHKDVCLKWTHAGNSVDVTGTFNDWGTPIPLEKISDAFGRGQLFSVNLKLVPGPHTFKFIVDGDWKYDPTIAFEADSFGNINNVMVVDGSIDVHLQEPVKVMRWTSMSGEEARRKWRIKTTIYRQEIERKALEKQQEEIRIRNNNNKHGSPTSNGLPFFDSSDDKSTSTMNAPPTLDSPITDNQNLNFNQSSFAGLTLNTSSQDPNIKYGNASSQAQNSNLHHAQMSMSYGQIKKLNKGFFDDKTLSEETISSGDTKTKSLEESSSPYPQISSSKVGDFIYLEETNHSNLANLADDTDKLTRSSSTLSSASNNDSNLALSSSPLYVKELSSLKLPKEDNSIEQPEIDKHDRTMLNDIRHELHQSTVEYGLDPGSTSLLNISLSRRGSKGGESKTEMPSPHMFSISHRALTTENEQASGAIHLKSQSRPTSSRHSSHYDSSSHPHRSTRSRSSNDLEAFKDQQQLFNQLGYYQYYQDPTLHYPFVSFPPSHSSFSEPKDNGQHDDNSPITLGEHDDNKNNDNINNSNNNNKSIEKIPIDLSHATNSIDASFTTGTVASSFKTERTTKSPSSNSHLANHHYHNKGLFKAPGSDFSFVQNPRHHPYYDPAIFNSDPLRKIPSVTSVTSDNEKHHLDAAVGSSQITNSTVKRDGKLLICMCGLPGTGKTLMAKMIRRHLEWMGMNVGYYGVSEYRRKVVGDRMPPSYFDPTNHEGYSSRMNVANMAIDDAIKEMNNQNIDIAVFDGSNMTKSRRSWIINRVEQRNLYAKVIFIESICVDSELLENNIHQTTLRSPDFKGMTRDEAIVEFKQRYRHYMSIYESIAEEEDISFMKIFDGGKKLVSYQVNGYIPGRLMLLLANIHTKPRQIWFSRHGESQYNTQGRIGGDSKLSKNGVAYAKKLTEFFDTVYKAKEVEHEIDVQIDERLEGETTREKGNELGGISGANGSSLENSNSSCTNINSIPMKKKVKNLVRPELNIWTSTMVRTGMTVNDLSQRWDVIKWRSLDEIDAGICDGMTYDEVAERYPEEYKKRKEDKYNYRYPRGESYQDVFLRLEPVIFEMLRQTKPLLIVGHQAILRILYGYLIGRKPETCTDLPVPLHTIMQLSPMAYGCEEIWHEPMKDQSNLHHNHHH